MTEQWKPVVGYENQYLVSDHGRVKSIASGRFNEHTSTPSRLNNAGLI